MYSSKTLGRMLRLVAAMLVIACTGMAYATDHALLIGVSDYPQLPRRLWLQGPVNDVGLVRTVLLDKGFADDRIQTLTSRSTAQREPTRQNILLAFERLKNSVRPGDHVFFYLAGHGSQQPQPTVHPGRPTEADGLDEVFLPSDVHQWDGVGTRALIPNALLDDEIGEWMDALVDAGATVWGVFDTCHAAGMARGKTGNARSISLADLGLPLTNAGTTSPKNRFTSPGARLDGRSLAFASRSHELAGEEWLPRGASLANTRRHGVFTFHLASALRGTRSLKASVLQQTVGATYATERRVAPVPQWVGDATLLWP